MISRQKLNLLIYNYKQEYPIFDTDAKILRKALDSHYKEIDKMKETIKLLKKNNSILKKAVDFYADSHHLCHTLDVPKSTYKNYMYPPGTCMMEDGSVARSARKKLKEV